MPLPIDPHTLRALIESGCRGILNVPVAGQPGEWQRIVIQGCAEGMGNVPGIAARDVQVRRLAAAPPAATRLQALRRAHHAAGTVEWNTLSPAERLPWVLAARGTSQTGYTRYLSDWLLRYAPPSGIKWDGGASVWDGGASIWT